MQVYVVVRNNYNKILLIAQKRQMNGFWGGQVGRDVAVNQAGQYCLPGGRAEQTDLSYTATALREFQEETGVNLADYAGIQFKEINYGDNFILVEANICLGHIFEIEKLANENLQPTQNSRPASSAVVDWELSRVIAVSDSVVDRYLGVRVTDPRNKIGPSGHRHAIDWYGWVGEYYAQ
ncbi:NUDIX hydrolase [Pseudomonas aeruginosa]|uniref:NUDIX hydrolase n=1 Tax=Pseudomonas aeruginosa TaxID=287 RepID=UPI00072265D5|nr:NUDIX hydrolase [Pseudomonas aeruginosa]EIU2894487.1 NUDIX domain-containing protein [Pseudomonas aeruginosa]EIU2921389.1 NUDIX domain-containing protein [Pseudomonas aeruginosa]EJN6724385.1 NUDIX domain-containing protein [Pseudomonas aeruginosa]EKU2415134.1 NUDIX domain-containing protein [Pseudomonas aeruginosa]EKU3897237.1 NUDIX domain-containing protein [Pseudomonas aeruginosa]